MQGSTVHQPGSRGRLGIIQPAPGLMLEAEWMRAVPPGVAFPVSRRASLPAAKSTERGSVGFICRAMRSGSISTSTGSAPPARKLLLPAPFAPA